MNKICPLCQKMNHTFHEIGTHKVIELTPNCNLNYILSENIEFDETKYYGNYFEKLRNDFKNESYIKGLSKLK